MTPRERLRQAAKDFVGLCDERLFTPKAAALIASANAVLAEPDGSQAMDALDRLRVFLNDAGCYPGSWSQIADVAMEVIKDHKKRLDEATAAAIALHRLLAHKEDK